MESNGNGSELGDGQSPLVEHPPPPKERRFKLSRACDRCRRRRIKCDEGHPCQSCLTANSSCTFDEPGKRSHPHKSKRTATLEDRMQHLETLIQAIPANIFNPALAQLPPAHAYPLGVPPPSLSAFPLMNPSTHFVNGPTEMSELAEATSRLSLTHSYLYLDDEGSTRWQGESSGLPLLDLLLEEDRQYRHDDEAAEDEQPAKPAAARPEVNPQTLWKAVTAVIPPDLMDNLVQVYLSTTYYLYPFLHVPSFLADYANPAKWGEPGFAAFVVSVCCIASRHVDDARVRSDPADPLSAGTHWLELFVRLRGAPAADRPTLYSIQALLTAAVYCIGLGKLSRGIALLAEAVSFSVDAGLHRNHEAYDWFDPLEGEVRKRTFWAVYMWDKQAAAAFGRPPLLRLRDCDVPEPSIVDDEYISRERLGAQPAGVESRMGAFVCALRCYVVLESVLVTAPPVCAASDPFLQRAAPTLTGAAYVPAIARGRTTMDFGPASPIELGGSPPPQHPTDHSRHSPMNCALGPTCLHMLAAEEHLLDAVSVSVPQYWQPTTETLASDDVVRITQAERILCIEAFVRMLLQRHRLSVCVAKRDMQDLPPGDGNVGRYTRDEIQATRDEIERDAIRGCQQAAMSLIAAHLSVASKGLMTYYGVHVIHQLTQAGRSLLAVLLECQHFIHRAPDAEGEAFFRALIPPSVDALRSCLGLLRRFSGRYVCGLRSADLIEECCRRTRIPLETGAPPGPDSVLAPSRRPWARPVRRNRRTTSTPRRNGEEDSSPSAQSQSPEAHPHMHDTPPPVLGPQNQNLPQQTAMQSQQTMDTLAGLPGPGPFLMGTESVPMAGSGMDVLEYGALDGGMGVDMSALDLMALLNYDPAVAPPPPPQAAFYPQQPMQGGIIR
ncbi:hypothetical protein AURDEDRAFT_116989 [Auricularia subglabra TFB-10046 SS5]|nr:hypothetical protein AURDEDRAFT_116989 [Auricularia subglabra TFB-10046 SS5]